MNAIWVGTFVSDGVAKKEVVVFRNSDELSIQFLVNTIAEEQAEDGWFLVSYELGVQDGRSN